MAPWESLVSLSVIVALLALLIYSNRKPDVTAEQLAQLSEAERLLLAIARLQRKQLFWTRLIAIGLIVLFLILVFNGFTVRMTSHVTPRVTPFVIPHVR